MATRNVKVEATLKDSGGTPLAGKSVNLYYRVSGTTTWNNFGTNPHTTDSKGVASDTQSLTVPQTYDFRAEFAGDAQYDASSAEQDNFTIKAGTTVTLTITPL